MADGKRSPTKLGIVPLLDGGIEGIHIQMQNLARCAGGVHAIAHPADGRGRLTSCAAVRRADL
jgi:hypothetical protein